MIYSIYRGATKLVDVQAEGKQSVSVMGENVVDVSFILDSYVDFQIGDFVIVFGTQYFLNQPVEPKKSGTMREYQYSMQFEALYYNLANVKLKDLDASSMFTVPKFTIMGNAEAIIDLIIANLNRSAIWTKGEIAATEAVLFSFDNENCLNALTKLAQQYNYEYWLEGNEINFSNRVIPTTLEFSYGKGKGLYEIARVKNNDNKPFNRLYVYGGTKNLPEGYRAENLLITNNPFGDIYIEDLADIAAHGLREEDLVLEDIYPKRVGTITSVSAGDEFLFTDSSMDFDVNSYLLEGVTAKVSFLTGLLAGYELELYSYDNDTKTFQLSLLEDEKVGNIPGDVLRPSVGDQYFIFDITMPESYVLDAQDDLYDKALEYFNRETNPANRYMYNVQCDPIFLKKNNIEPSISQRVHITDTLMGIDEYIRIDRTVRDLQRIWDFQLEVKNVPTISNIGSQYVFEKEVQYTVEAIKPLKPKNYRSIRAMFARFREFMGKVFDPDGYFDGSNIKPNTVETLALSVGAKSSNFKLEGIIFNINVDGNPNKVTITEGVLIHLELEVPTLGFIWDMNPFTTVLDLDPAKFYYIYAKCSKSALTGEWVISENQITAESVTGYYHFLTAVLYKVDADGHRFLDLINGVTTIVGDKITTGKITSIDGLSYFDLDLGKLVGNDVDLTGKISSGEGDIGGFIINERLIKSGDSGKRLELDSEENALKFYNSLGGKDLEMAFDSAASDQFYYFEIDGLFNAGEFVGANRTIDRSAYNAGSYDSRTGLEGDFTEGFPYGYDWRLRQQTSTPGRYRYWFRILTPGFRAGDPDKAMESYYGAMLPSTTVYDNGIITGNVMIAGKLKTSVYDHRVVGAPPLGFSAVNIIDGNFTLPLPFDIVGGNPEYTLAKLNTVGVGTEIVLCQRSTSSTASFISTNPSGNYILDKSGTYVSYITLSPGQTACFKLFYDNTGNGTRWMEVWRVS